MSLSVASPSTASPLVASPLVASPLVASPTIHEVIAVCDRGDCELDLWVTMNGGTRHYSTKHLDPGQLKSAVMEIAKHLFRDVAAELQSAHRYIFNLTPHYMMLRQFEYVDNDSVLKDCRSLDDPGERRAAMHLLSNYLKEAILFK